MLHIVSEYILALKTICVYLMTSSFVFDFLFCLFIFLHLFFLNEISLWVNMFVSVSICVSSDFSVVLFLIWFFSAYLICLFYLSFIFFKYSLDAYLFSIKKQKGCRSRYEGRWEGVEGGKTITRTYCI